MNGGSIERGDIFYIDKYSNSGSEQAPGRPAVVVSNDMCNEFSPVVEVVYLTTQPKSNMPTHVTIRSASRVSTALCEQITSVSKERIGNWSGRVTEDEMKRIEAAMLVSLNLADFDIGQLLQDDKPHYYAPPTPASSDAHIIEVLEAERNLYKSLYEDMLNRAFPVKKRGG